MEKVATNEAIKILLKIAKTVIQTNKKTKNEYGKKEAKIPKIVETPLPPRKFKNIE